MTSLVNLIVGTFWEVTHGFSGYVPYFACVIFVPGSKVGVSQLIEAEAKWSPFCRQHFKCIFSNENVRISIQISRQFVPRGQIYSNPTLVQIMNLWWVVYWRIYASLGLSELTDFFHSVISPFVQNHQNTRCLSNITFIPDRYIPQTCQTWIWFKESDRCFFRNEYFPKLTSRALVTPTPRLLVKSISNQRMPGFKSFVN